MKHDTMLLWLLAVFTVPLLIACQPVTPVQPSQPALNGQPSWLPLGGEVYQERDRTEAEKQVLAFIPEPRWFLGYSKLVSTQEYNAVVQDQQRNGKTLHDVQRVDGMHYLPSTPPYPKTLADLPLEDQGVRLAMDAVGGDDPHVVILHLRLSSRDRKVWREVEHRWTNTLPFLFAFYIDGQAVSLPSKGFSKFGGVNYSVPLVEAGETQDWSLKVDSESLRKLLPNDEHHELTLVAAFSERQHEGYFANSHIASLADEYLTTERGVQRQVLLRSNLVRLRWSGTTWTVVASPIDTELHKLLHLGMTVKEAKCALGIDEDAPCLSAAGDLMQVTIEFQSPKFPGIFIDLTFNNIKNGSDFSTSLCSWSTATPP